MDFGIRVGAGRGTDGSILLVRHQKPERAPYWVLPGGRLEPGETIPECAERELFEETGLTVQFSEVLYVSEFMREGRHTVDITVRGCGGTGRRSPTGKRPGGRRGGRADLEGVEMDEGIGLERHRVAADLDPARIIEDAGRGWRTGEIYLDGAKDQ